MNNDVYQRLNRIDDELIQLCEWLNEKCDVDSASRLIPILDDLTSLLAEMSMETR